MFLEKIRQNAADRPEISTTPAVRSAGNAAGLLSLQTLLVYPWKPSQRIDSGGVSYGKLTEIVQTPGRAECSAARHQLVAKATESRSEGRAGDVRLRDSTGCSMLRRFPRVPDSNQHFHLC